MATKLKSKSKLQQTLHKPHHSAKHHHEKGQIEPIRKSVLDALHDNFRKSERQTYVHRMIYVGEHLHENVVLNFRFEMLKVIKTVNDRYCDEKLTGFFYYYARYFCHFLDGSEEALIKHLKLLLTTEPTKSELGRMKLLIVYHHVNQRMMEEWMEVSAKPATLLEKIVMDADLTYAMAKVRYCVDKLYQLGLAMRPTDVLIEDKISELYEAEMRRKELEQSASMQNRRLTNLFGQIVNPIHPHLPELSILEFLLATSYTQDLRSYFQLYGEIPYLDAYGDLVWPVPSDFVPMNIYEEDVDPVVDLTVKIPL